MDSTPGFYASPKGKKALSFKLASDRISTGLSRAADSDRVVNSGNTARAARSLFDKERTLVMTYGVKFDKKVCQTAISYKCNLTQQSASSTQAHTISPVQKAIERVNEESDNEEDANGTPEDEYGKGYNTDVDTDAESASDDEAYKV